LGDCRLLIFAASRGGRRTGLGRGAQKSDRGGGPSPGRGSVSASWPEAELYQKISGTAYKGVITYRSLGPASDSFLHIMDKLYGTALHPKSMRAETKFTGISLRGKPDELEKEPVRIKVFYESDDEQRYAELFTNIDVQHRVLQINEKDEEYRKPVVRALSAE
jgi:hypothetical protein